MQFLLQFGLILIGIKMGLVSSRPHNHVNVVGGPHGPLKLLAPDHCPSAYKLSLRMGPNQIQ